LAYSAKVGSFNIDTTKTPGQTQAITGVGFQPKVVLFWWSGSAASSDEVAGGTISSGFAAAISSTSRFCVLSISEDDQATSDCRRGQFDALLMRMYTDTATIDGVADFSSMDADGFTLTITDQFTVAYRISYLALGGTDLTNAYIGNKQRDADPGACSVTGVGFQPDAVILASAWLFNPNTTGNGEGISFGWATGSSNQGIVATASGHNQATSSTRGYGYNGEVAGFVLSYASSLFQRDSFVSFDADGFTLNQLEGTDQYYYHFLCLKGGQYAVGDLTTRTDGNDIEEDVGFQPVAVLFGSANRALSTQDTSTTHNRLSIGAGTSTSNRAAQAISDEDGLADTETAYTNQDDAVYAHVIDDAIEALMDIKSIDADGFTCVMDDVETAGCWVTYLAIGAEAAGATYTLTADQGSLSLAGQAAAVLAARLLAADAGALSLSGQSASTLASRLLTAAQGTLTLSGQSASLLASRLLEAAQGTLSLAGQSAGLLASRLLSAEMGAISLSGQDAGLLVARLLEAAAGIISFTGLDATLTYTPVGPTYTLTAETGTIGMSGQAAALLAARLLTGEAGVISLAGQDAAVLRGFLLSTETGAISLAGQDAGLTLARLLRADAGVLTLAGQAVTFVYSGMVTPDSRIFVIVAEGRVYVIAAESRVYAVPGESRMYAINA